MRCAWNELIQILPQRLRNDVDRLGKETLQELRLRVGQPPWMVTTEKVIRLPGNVTSEEVAYVIHVASRYSPWSAATAAQGYITSTGGHRIGICGSAVVKSGVVTGIRDPISLCIRVARDVENIAENAARVNGNILILGPPGSGKTTLLRDLIRKKAAVSGPVGVIDEREELFPHTIPVSEQIDVLRGCRKVDGIPMVLRTMGPKIIAVDEITDESDCKALMEAAWCGVNVIATAHATDLNDLRGRPVYRPLIGCELFEHAVILARDKSYCTRRILL